MVKRKGREVGSQIVRLMRRERQERNLVIKVYRRFNNLFLVMLL